MMISQEKVSKIYKVFERLSQELLTDLLQHFQKKKYKKCNFFSKNSYKKVEKIKVKFIKK